MTENPPLETAKNPNKINNLRSLKKGLTFGLIGNTIIHIVD